MAVAAPFTPSLLDVATLERLFVNRHHLLHDAVDRIERAAASEERAAKLFVGPRGAGKTHLISLVYHRARALPGFGSRFQLAWLPEDSWWTISSLDDLAVETLAALEPAFEWSGPRPMDAVIDAARRGGPIVLLVENLNDVLPAIGADGQRELRGLLENHRPLLLVATATRLGEELLGQAEPFYGFFDTTELAPFDVKEAARMLQRMAEVNGDPALAAWLAGRRAEYRLATVAHLAGGQPRVWALLGSGLTIEGLDELVSTLIERFDQLTPYYQQQLDRLSLNERRAVRALVAADGALAVAEIAARTGIEQRSLGKTITELRRRGWIVRRTGLLAERTDQRRSYYQLAEPLARLAFQLKEARGRPVRLVVEFLKAWFDRDLLAPGSAGGELVHAYRESAYRSMRTDAPLAVAKALSARFEISGTVWASDPTVGLFHPDPQAPVNAVAGAVLLELDDAVAAFEAGDAEPLLTQPPAISQLIERHLGDTSPARTRLQLAHLGLSSGDAERWIPHLRDLCSPGDSRVEATALLALCHARSSDPGPASLLLTELAASASAQNAHVLLWLGERLLEQRSPERARPILEAARPHTAPGELLRLAIALEASLQRSGGFSEVVGLWAGTHATLADAQGPDHPDTLAARANLAMAHHSAGHLAQAQALFEALLPAHERVLGPDHAKTLAIRGDFASWTGEAGDAPRALALSEALLPDHERVLGPDHPATLSARGNVAYWTGEAGDVPGALALFEALLPEHARVLGPDHPHTLTTRNNVAYCTGELGDAQGALVLSEALLPDHARALGPDHPDTLVARGNVAYWTGEAGDVPAALALFEALLPDYERVLGPDHPDTLRTRAGIEPLKNDQSDAERPASAQSA